MPELQGALSDGIRMPKNIVALLFFLFASCGEIPKDFAPPPLPTPKKELKTDIPDAPWVKILFDGFEFEEINKNGKGRTEKRGGLDKLAADNGFSKLRETVLPENDLEARVWVGFGKYGNDGLILKRSGGSWSGAVLKQMLCHSESRGKYDLKPPRSGWDAAWQKLVDKGILTLPDSSKLKYEGGILDGKSYVVETNYEYLYRIYEYGNPNYEKLKEAAQMVEIGKIIAAEFDLESFSTETGGCEKK